MSSASLHPRPSDKLCAARTRPITQRGGAAPWPLQRRFCRHRLHLTRSSIDLSTAGDSERRAHSQDTFVPRRPGLLVSQWYQDGELQHLLCMNREDRVGVSSNWSCEVSSKPHAGQRYLPTKHARQWSQKVHSRGKNGQLNHRRWDSLRAIHQALHRGGGTGLKQPKGNSCLWIPSCNSHVLVMDWPLQPLAYQSLETISETGKESMVAKFKHDAFQLFTRTATLAHTDTVASCRLSKSLVPAQHFV